MAHYLHMWKIITTFAHNSLLYQRIKIIVISSYIFLIPSSSYIRKAPMGRHNLKKHDKNSL